MTFINIIWEGALDGLSGHAVRSPCQARPPRWEECSPETPLRPARRSTDIIREAVKPVTQTI